MPAKVLAEGGSGPLSQKPSIVLGWMTLLIGNPGPAIVPVGGGLVARVPASNQCLYASQSHQGEKPPQDVSRPFSSSPFNADCLGRANFRAFWPP